MTEQIVNIVDPDKIQEYLATDKGKETVLAVIKGDENTVRQVIGASKSVAREMELEQRLRLAEEMIDRLEPYFQFAEKFRKIIHDHYDGAGVSRSGYNSKFGDYSYYEGAIDKFADPLREIFKELLVTHWKENENPRETPLEILFDERGAGNE